MRVLLALIHNSDHKRLEAARETAATLQSQIRDSCRASVDYLEVFKQDPLPEVSRRMWRRVRRMSNYSQYRYLRYHIGSRIRRWLPFLLAFFTDAIRIPGHRDRWRLGVEHAVTRKHLQALAAGVGYDFIMVIEDDAMIRSGYLQPGEQIGPALQQAFAQLGSLSYIDFAGGFALEEVAPDSVEQSKAGFFVSSSRLFTNTACGYAMSAKLAKLILSEVGDDGRQAWLGIDFLFNRVFCNRTRTSSVNCFHLTQSSIVHGSMNGNYKSWEKTET